MKIELMVIGKTSARYLQEGIDNYVKRTNYYMPFDIRYIPDIKSTKAMTEEKQKEKEGELFLNALTPGDVLVLLDERGKEMTSREFASYIDRKSVTVSYGFSPAMYERADDKISLSKMTFSHEMVRLFFVEQTYRAMTILRGEPYHHD